MRKPGLEKAMEGFSSLEKAMIRQKMNEERAIYNIEKTFKNDDRNFYVAFEDININWYWTRPEIKQFYELWESGAPIKEIAKILNRKPIEIALFIMDRDYLGKIHKREGGIWGHK